MKDLFSKQAQTYAQFRPEYPDTLYDFILSHCPARKKVWDCGTGNGQAARVLSRHFEQVFASDISEKQLDHAYQAENIHYSIQPAEKTDYPDQFFDLIVVAQALHWFKFEHFFQELGRVAKSEALFAAWGYEVLHIDHPEINARMDHFYRVITDPYWEPERKHIENHFAQVPFPFKTRHFPDFEIAVKWNRTQFEGYLNSWSATQKCIRLTGENPVDPFIQEISPLWPAQQTLSLRFPVFLLMGHIS